MDDIYRPGKPMRRVTIEEALRMRELYASGVSMREVVRRFDRHQAIVRAVLAGTHPVFRKERPQE